MKTLYIFQWILGALLLTLIASTGRAEIDLSVPVPDGPHVSTVPPTAQPRPDTLRPDLLLAVELVDGSHVIGAPGITSVTLRTSFAKMDIPLARITGITLKDDHETAWLSLSNGDTLTGVLDLGPTELKTSFGTISVPANQMRGISVSPAGVPRGLLLWNRLDGGPSLVGPDVDFLSKTGFVDGKVGRAVEVAGNNEWGFQVALETLKRTPRGTVEYWMMVVRKPATVSHGAGPIYDMMHGGLRAQYNANDGGAHGKHAISSGGYFVYTERYSSSKSTDLLGREGVWNHYAIEWDTEGIEGRNGAKLAFLINGKPHGKYQPGAGEASRFAGPFHEGAKDKHLKFHRNRNGFAGTMVYDELKIWNHPVADFKRTPTAVMSNGDAGGERQPVTFVLDLTGGSRLLGTPGLKALTFTTESFGRVSLPMRQITKMVFDQEHETCQVVLDSGDVLVGSLGHDDFPFTTIFGPIAVKLDRIVSICSKD
ncbi:MAG: hypothetical protein HN919_12395 [Verrucomicrobia bacterium]|nr:hypothetical protein [Verrucomicrobiota bacterium]MBT7699231.1 hypothetical protein [Verrucomicrobiota bacterium]